MNHASNRTLSASLLTMCTLALCSLALRAEAQSLTEFAPLEWHTSGTHSWDAGVTTLLIGVGRTVPVYTVLPQTTVDSRFRLLDFNVGARFVDGAGDFRYRVTALDLDIQRTPQSASFTLLDLNKSGLRDSHITWIRAGYGPALSYTTWHRQAVLKTRLEAGLVSSKWGSTVFGTVPGYNVTETGFEGRLFGGASLTLASTLDVGLTASHAVYSFEGDFEYTEIVPTLSWFARPTVRMDVSLTWTRGRARGVDVKDMAGGLRVSYTPRAIRF